MIDQKKINNIQYKTTVEKATKKVDPKNVVLDTVQKPIRKRAIQQKTTPKKQATQPTNNTFKFLFAAKKDNSSKRQTVDKSNRTKRDNSGRKIAIFVIMFAISTFAFLASISHIFTWETQMNICGGFGYQIANIIVGNWFGIWGFILPFLLLFATVLAMNPTISTVRKIVVSSLIALAFFPLITAFIGSFFNDNFCGVGVGGNYGSAFLNLIKDSIGQGGLIILSIILPLLWILYTIPNSHKIFLKTSKKFTDKMNNIDVEEEKPQLSPEKQSSLKDMLSRSRRKKDDEPIKDDGIDVRTDVVEESMIDESEQTSQRELNKQTIGGRERRSSQYIDVDEQIRRFEDRRHDELTGTFEEEEKEENIIVIPTEQRNNFEVTQKEIDDIPMIDVILEPEEQTDNSISDDNDDDGVDFEISVTGSANLINSDGIDVKINVADELDDNDISQEVYDPTKELSNFKLPSISLLLDRPITTTVSAEEKVENKRKIVSTLKEFGINIESIRVTAGPTVTLYEIVPSAGVRISKIKGLEDNIALSLSALGIRIIAPMPGQGTVGIEVPNKNTETVSMYSVAKSKAFQESTAELPIVMGRTIQNKDFVFDLAKAPHLLVAGATGQGKSVGLNVIMASLLYKKHPAELKFVLIDPKKVELAMYQKIEKHYLAKLADAEEAIITDTDKVINTLNSLCLEMDQRYTLLKQAGVVKIIDYNKKFKNRKLNPNKGHRYLPYIVVVIDEFADLIMTAGKEIETPIARIAQLARAIGIHLVIATQRPTVNIITGVIKANFPTRIAFRVTSSTDSKTILDQVGANQLIGCGDMLVAKDNEITRVQCAFVDTPEIENITAYIGDQQGYVLPYELPECIIESSSNDNNGGYGDGNIQRRDSQFEEIARYVVTNQQGSASTIQRNFSIGFNKAGRIMDQLEKAGIVGSQHGNKPRTVLVTDLTSLEILLIDIDRR